MLGATAYEVSWAGKPDVWVLRRKQRIRRDSGSDSKMPSVCGKLEMGLLSCGHSRRCLSRGRVSIPLTGKLGGLGRAENGVLRGPGGIDVTEQRGKLGASIRSRTTCSGSTMRPGSANCQGWRGAAAGTGMGHAALATFSHMGFWASGVTGLADSIGLDFLCLSFLWESGRGFVADRYPCQCCSRAVAAGSEPMFLSGPVHAGIFLRQAQRCPLPQGTCNVERREPGGLGNRAPWLGGAICHCETRDDKAGE